MVKVFGFQALSMAQPHPIALQHLLGFHPSFPLETGKQPFHLHPLWTTSCLAVSRFWSYCWPGWVRAGCKEVTLEDNSILLQWAVRPSTSRRKRLSCQRWLIIQTIARATQPGCLGLLGLGFPKVPFLTEHSGALSVFPPYTPSAHSPCSLHTSPHHFLEREGRNFHATVSARAKCRAWQFTTWATLVFNKKELRRNIEKGC